MSDLLKPSKQPKVKKTLNELLGEGQVKTGKTLLEQAALKTQQQEAFLAAPQKKSACAPKRVSAQGKIRTSRLYIALSPHYVRVK